MAFLITSSVLRLPLATWEGEEDILVLAPMYLQKAAFLFMPIQSFCSWVDEDKSQSAGSPQKRQLPHRGSPSVAAGFLRL